MSRYRWVVFGVLAVGYIFVYFHRLCTAVVVNDMMRDLEASATLVGFLGAAYFYPYALMQVPSGLLADSWGPRKTITLFLLVAAAGSVILGTASGVTFAIVGRVLVGLGVAMLFVATLKTLTQWFSKDEFPMMASVLLAAGGVGSLSATAPFAWLSSWAGWRASFVYIGIATIGVAAAVWLFVRDKPADARQSPAADVGDGAAPSPGVFAAIGMVVRRAAFWPLAIWFFFDMAVFFTFAGLWGSPYLEQTYIIDKTHAGRVLSMFAVGLIVGAPLWSFVQTRVGARHKPLLVFSSACLVVVTAFWAFCTDTLPLEAQYGLCLGLGLFGNSIAGITFAATKELFPVAMAGTVLGIVNFFPFAGGAVFQPLLGLVLERYKLPTGSFSAEGYHHAFLILFGCSVGALLAALCVRESAGVNAA